MHNSTSRFNYQAPSSQQNPMSFPHYHLGQSHRPLGSYAGPAQQSRPQVMQYQNASVPVPNVPSYGARPRHFAAQHNDPSMMYQINTSSVRPTMVTQAPTRTTTSYGVRYDLPIQKSQYGSMPPRMASPMQQPRSHMPTQPSPTVKNPGKPENFSLDSLLDDTGISGGSFMEQLEDVAPKPMGANPASFSYSNRGNEKNFIGSPSRASAGGSVYQRPLEGPRMRRPSGQQVATAVGAPNSQQGNRSERLSMQGALSPNHYPPTMMSPNSVHGSSSSIPRPNLHSPPMQPALSQSPVYHQSNHNMMSSPLNSYPSNHTGPLSAQRSPRPMSFGGEYPNFSAANPNLQAHMRKTSPYNQAQNAQVHKQIPDAPKNQHNVLSPRHDVGLMAPNRPIRPPQPFPSPQNQHPMRMGLDKQQPIASPMRRTSKDVPNAVSHSFTENVPVPNIMSPGSSNASVTPMMPPPPNNQLSHNIPLPVQKDVIGDQNVPPLEKNLPVNHQKPEATIPPALPIQPETPVKEPLKAVDAEMAASTAVGAVTEDDDSLLPSNDRGELTGTENKKDSISAEIPQLDQPQVKQLAIDTSVSVEDQSSSTPQVAIDDVASQDKIGNSSNIPTPNKIGAQDSGVNLEAVEPPSLESSQPELPASVAPTIPGTPQPPKSALPMPSVPSQPRSMAPKMHNPAMPVAAPMHGPLPAPPRMHGLPPSVRPGMHGQPAYRGSIPQGMPGVRMGPEQTIGPHPSHTAMRHPSYPRMPMGQRFPRQPAPMGYPERHPMPMHGPANRFPPGYNQRPGYPGQPGYGFHDTSARHQLYENGNHPRPYFKPSEQNFAIQVICLFVWQP